MKKEIAGKKLLAKIMKNKTMFLCARRIIIISFAAATCLFGCWGINSPQASAAGTTRDSIPNQYKWNTSDLYPTPEAWEKDFIHVSNDLLPALNTFKGKLNNKNMALQFLQKSTETSIIIEKLSVYSFMKKSENQGDSHASEIDSRIVALSTDVSQTTAFAEPEFLSLPDNIIKDYQKDPAFSDYSHYFDILLLQKPHTLSEKEEKLLAAAGELASAPGNIYSKQIAADLKFPTIKDTEGKDTLLSEGSFMSNMLSPNRDFRMHAFKGTLDTYASEKNTLAATLEAQVKTNIFFAEARNYPSALEASLAQENIPKGVYDNLILSVGNNLQPLHNYISLRKKVLGIDKVHMYDMFIPLTDEYTMNIPYDQARETVLEGLAPLGTQYISDLTQGLTSNWVDVYETANKESGAYEIDSYGTHPFILMNYYDSLDDMQTLAHESGHAMHAYYSNINQPYNNSDTPIFTAEVASTTNELLMMDYLIKNSKSKEEKIYLLSSYIETIRGTLYVQTMFAEFEQSIHERVEQGQALSPDSLSEIWQNLLVKYYGPDFAANEETQWYWIRIPHFYYNFYVYKYATSLAAAYDIVSEVEKGDQKAVQAYLKFLSSGNSEYPVDTLKNAGTDPSSPEAVNTLLTKFNSLLNELEVLLNEKTSPVN